MPLLFGHDETVAEWVGKINGKPFYPPFSAFGVVNGDGRLIGGFVFNGYNGDAIEMSVAGGASLTRTAMRAAMFYVFNQQSCSRLQIHTRRRNKLVRKFAPMIGFRFEGVSRRHYGNEDGLCYSITRDDLPKIVERWKL